MIQKHSFTRRHLLYTASAFLLFPHRAGASSFTEITWDDLIPPGVPYGEIIGEGEINLQTDVWNPVYDENASKLNTDLDGKHVKLPGFIVPLETGSAGLSEFLLVPYQGACIHVPPPPPNQLVYVQSNASWPADEVWNPIWVYGRLSAKPTATQIADTGYQLVAEKIEIYEW